jgi:DNA repair protein RadC
VAVDFRQLIGRGLRIGAAGFLLVHNHLSGDPRPSAADVQVTNRLRRLSAELEMPLLDHLIVAGAKFARSGGRPARAGSPMQARRWHRQSKCTGR